MNYTLKVVLITIIAIVFVASVGYGGYVLGTKKDSNTQATPTSTATTDIVTKTSSSATSTVSSVPKSSPTASASDESLIKQAVYDKLGTSESDIKVEIEKIEGDYAKGYSHSAKEESGGGFFIAVKKSGTWKVIADGNGVIECSVTEEYNVPSTIVGECYDSSTGESKTR